MQQQDEAEGSPPPWVSLAVGRLVIFIINMAKATSVSRTEQLDPWAVRAKKHYSVREIYSITRVAVGTARHVARLRRERGEQYTERIMLAVTEVNGCALCAYGHTRFALEAGLSPAEVRDLLGGVATNSPDDESRPSRSPSTMPKQEATPSRMPGTASCRSTVSGRHSECSAPSE